jgi:hypothetical protein
MRIAVGSQEAVARLRFPQNVACGFPAPRSSAICSEHREALQGPISESDTPNTVSIGGDSDNSDT